MSEPTESAQPKEQQEQWEQSAEALAAQAYAEMVAISAYLLEGAFAGQYTTLRLKEASRPWATYIVVMGEVTNGQEAVFAPYFVRLQDGAIPVAFPPALKGFRLVGSRLDGARSANAGDLPSLARDAQYLKYAISQRLADAKAPETAELSGGQAQLG